MEAGAWNTGRKYGAQGQRIAAIQLADGRVAFWDADRGIDGITNCEYDDFFKEIDTLQSFVMSCYDGGSFTDGLYITKAIRPELMENLRDAMRSMIQTLGGAA